jgi:hypothetical protein
VMVNAVAARRACRAILIELVESVNPSNLLKLGTKAFDLSPELHLELGVLRLIRRKMLLSL